MPATEMPPATKSRPACLYCTEGLTAENSVIMSSNCKHVAKVCRNCARESISAQVDEGHGDFHIVDDACGARLKFSEVRRLAEPKIFER